MGLRRRSRRVRGAIIAAAVIATLGAPSLPAASSPVAVDAAASHAGPTMTLTALERLRRLGAPSDLLRDIERAVRRPTDEDYVFEGTVGFGLPAEDLDGDGREDVLATVIDYRITISFDTVPSLLFADISYEGETRIEAISGPDGRRLWRSKYDELVLPLPARVGPKGRPGAFVLKEVFSFLGPVEQYRLTIEAINGATGKALWTRDYDAQVLYQYPVLVAKGIPLGIDVLDALPGRATDLVLGTGDVVWGGALYVDGGVEVVDGRNGKAAVHPQRYRSANWIPSPWRAGDLDRSGGEDYVVFNSPGASGGGGATDLGVTALARGGRDGAPLWAAPLPLEDLAWPYPLGDLTGDRVPDLGVVTGGERGLDTILVEGADGAAGWRKPGAWPYAPGDINRDGKTDVILRAMGVAWNKGEQRFVSAAYTAGGKGLWRRVIRQRFRQGPCRGDFCFTWAWGGWMEVGDIEPDGIDDMWATLGVEGDTTPLKVSSHTIAGRSGESVLRGGDGFLALDGSLHGRGTDALDLVVHRDRAEVAARRGNDGAHLWTSTLRTSGRWPRKDLLRLAEAARLTGSDCADVVLVISAPKRSLLAALRGRDGSVLWSRTLSGRKIALQSESRPVMTSCG